jgi:hypothetical protein
MAYLRASRYGITHMEPTEALRAAGWRQVWRHPSGTLAMRHPITGHWVLSDGYEITDEGFSSSLRAAARRIDHLTHSASAGTTGLATARLGDVRSR